MPSQMYHPSSTYGKLTKLLESDECLCGNSKRAFTPFCRGCYEELDSGGFPTKTLYYKGEKGLESMLDGIHELRFEEKFNKDTKNG